MLGEARDQGRIVEHRIAADVAQHLHQRRIGLEQPAAEGDAVGLVDDAVGIERVQIVEHGLAHQVGVQRRDAVDPVRADEGEMAHPQLAVAVLVDQRDGGEPVRKALWILVFRGLEVLGIDAIDDLQMARQHALEQVDRPGLQRLRQQRVVGVGERADGDLPGVAPRQAMHVDQEPHQLGDRDARMRVVELDRGPLRQEMQIAVGAQVARHQILQRGGDEEIFLPQAQFAAGRRFVARIEDLRDRLRARLLDQRADMIAAVEGVEPQRVDRARGPQPQRIHVAAAPSDDRRVVGDRLDGLVRQPDVARGARPGSWMVSTRPPKWMS